MLAHGIEPEVLGSRNSNHHLTSFRSAALLHLLFRFEPEVQNVGHCGSGSCFIRLFAHSMIVVRPEVIDRRVGSDMMCVCVCLYVVYVCAKEETGWLDG